QKPTRILHPHDEWAGSQQKYQDMLINMRRYDYDDMIIEVLNALKKNGDLLADLREQYQYILIDEHQDTNNSQNRIVELIANYHKNPNVFMVGDEKQAIFRFQGASLENFLYFREIYPDALVVTMSDNYRSTQAILDGADSIISIDKKLRARAGHNSDKINVGIFSRPEAESFFISYDIETKIKSGVLPQEIVILCRDNNDTLPFIGDLEKRGIPFFIESDEDILTDLLIRKIVFILQAINKFGDQELFIECLHIDFLGINPLDIYRLTADIAKNKVSVFSVVKDEEAMKKQDFITFKQISSFYQKMTRWSIKSKNSSFMELLEAVIYESGLMDDVLKRKDSVDRVAKISSLFKRARIMAEKHRNYQLKDFIEYLDILEKYSIRIKKESLVSQGNRVRLMTVHKAKGLEFDYVYIVGVVDGHWGNRHHHDSLPLATAVYSLSGKAISDKNTDDDERKLFYVAITRAKKGVTITYSREGYDGRERLGSRFVEEIRPELINQLETVPIEEQMSGRYLSAPVVHPTSYNIEEYRNFVAQLFKERGLAVTALNNYLECPWKYFYLNLLRIPKAKSKHQLFGTAVHQALKEFFDEVKKDNESQKLLVDRFIYQLRIQPFSENEYKETLAKGKKALIGYYQTYKGKWNTNTITELNIDRVDLSPDIRLTGKIDKIEIIDNLGHINVVDYKTGKPKSRGEIEGSTKNSNGDIKRQLVFYRLLLDNFQNGRYRMASGEIDFVEPNDKGKYIKEQFIVLDEEMKALRELVIKTAKEITALDFWDKRCEDKECEFCRLREMMHFD
ncbi:MAG: ATP-dependent DNA helicase, partial [bacterium]